MPFLKFNVHCVLRLNPWTTTTTSTSTATVTARTIILLYSLTIILTVHSARIQTYTIYSEPEGHGEKESFTENIQDLFTVSKLVKNGTVKWKCIERGIWLEYSGVNYNFKNRNTFQYQHILYDGKCFLPTRPVQSIRHIGNSDLELPGISLYRQENFAGEELYFDGTMLQLPVSITFQSFGFTGQEPWTLYSGTDFTGESNVCLQPQRTDEVVNKKDILDSQLIFYNTHTSHTLYVGSIRRGCGHHNGGSSFGHQQHSSSVMHPQITNKRRPTTPTLSLFSQMTAREHMLSMDGTEAKLPGTGHTFVAYTIGGNNNWTIYSGSEFNGVSKCLVAVPENATVPEEQHHQLHAYSYPGGFGGSPVGTPIENVTAMGETPAFAVGSIRRGCDTDGSGTTRWGSSFSLTFMAIITIITVMATIM